MALTISKITADTTYDVKDTVYGLATQSLAGLMSKEDKSRLDNLLNLIYPVGSIYMSMTNTSPQSFLGGTWEKLSGGFLYGAVSSSGVGNGTGTSTGGTAITTAQMPAHTHTFTGSAVTSGNNSVGHTHTFTDYYAASTTGSTTLTAAQSGLPSHSHTVNSHSHTYAADFYIRHCYWADGESIVAGTNTTVTKFAYSSTWNTAFSTQNYSHKPDRVNIGGSTGTASPGTTSTSANASSGHTHSVTNTSSPRTSSGISANHTHSFTAAGSNSNTGSGSTHSHTVPYMAVFVWKRTA